VVGYPVLVQQWDELFCVFVGEVHSGGRRRPCGRNRGRDEVGESMRTPKRRSPAGGRVPGAAFNCGPKFTVRSGLHGAP
jgi:hypothetical protein